MSYANLLGYTGWESIIESVQSLPVQLTGDFLQWAILFFVLAIIAAAVGARGIAGVSMEIARIFILIFLVLAIISLLL
ncbi:DUF1328 domain-containing protein [Natranaeroarchaeum sulfidigenes]|uniref:UPF0391 membrane protein AArcS_2163 n=1 Tax=Natranaeroarchaeum sulfidigenes TaxID=2784880 RepID=A0A897MST5_9EURY|nr:DUF1328 domain-containing protein [Natranaeroarchaeum sulfidigenes]QSG03361.1 Small integral membrane protein [Natranaeroarchaeum sulfidigenes]